MANACRRRGAIVALLLSIATTAAPIPASSRRSTAKSVADSTASTVRYRLAAGRIIVPIGIVQPDGTERKVLAWLNMGTPKMALAPGLARELGAGSGHPLVVRFAGVEIPVAPDLVEARAPELDGEDALAHLFAPLPVEAVLPARVLQSFRLVIDFPARQVTLAPPGDSAPDGIATPLLLNPETGVAAVEATVAGEPHRLAIDAGASFTWLRGSLVKSWLAAHPAWRRAYGAVGASNMGLTGLSFERDGTLRLPETVIAGRVSLAEIGALATAPLICEVCDRLVGDLFWEGWQANAPVPVAGWLGNNVLGDFKLTVDYPSRTLYWLRRRQNAPGAISEVGVTLVRHGGGYAIGGVVAKDGAPSVIGAQVGDRLLAIDGVATDGRSSDDVLGALGGRPGARHTLDLERGGERFQLEAPVTAF